MAGVQGPGIPYGQNFLSGQVTSVFAGSGLVSGLSTAKDAIDSIQNCAGNISNQLRNMAMSTVSSVMGNAGAITGKVMGIGSNVLGDMNQIKDMASIALQEVFAYGSELVTSYVTNLLTPPVELISSYATKKFAEESAGQAQEIMDNLTKINELTNIDNMTAVANNAMEGFTDYMNECVGDMNEKLNSTISVVTKEIEQIEELSLAGTSWVTRKINTIKDQAKEEINKFISEKTKGLVETRNKFAYNAGNTMGKKAADEIKKVNGNELKNKLDKIEAAKVSAKTFAKTQIQAAILKIKSMVGG